MTQASNPSDRFHGLDALRGGALLLGVVLHAVMSFFPAGVWIVADNDPTPVLSGVFFVIHLFRMTTFFLLAGFFAHLSLHRYGLGGFVADRLKRIAGPLFVFWPIVFPAIVAVIVWAAWVKGGGHLPSNPPPPPAFTVESFPLTHLWFLWVLLIFYAVLLLVRLPLSALDRGGGMRRLADRIVGGLLGPWSPAVFAAPLALSLYLLPNWLAFFGIPTPDHSLIPNPPALVGFGTAFALGYMLHRRPERLKLFERWWGLYLIAAVVSGAAALILAGGPNPQLTPVTEPDLKALLAALYAFAVFASSFAALGLTLRFLSARSAVRRYLADAAYWVYIVHLPVVMAAQVLVANLAWPWPLKFAVILVGSLSIILLSYQLLVRHSFIGRFLNGTKRRRQVQAE